MRTERDNIKREEVVRFYVGYDRRKKNQAPPVDMDRRPWDDPVGIDRKLKENELKQGVLAAYRKWKLVDFGVVDLLESAIYKGIFPGEPQALCRLALLGKVAKWFPDRGTDWWQPIGAGSDINAESALIVRPALSSEAPAKWYIEDGSGRALALLQRILRYGEVGRRAKAYLGCEPDEGSAFIGSRPELWAGVQR